MYLLNISNNDINHCRIHSERTVSL